MALFREKPDEEKLKFLLIKGSRCHKIASRNLISEAKRFFDVVLSVPLEKIRVECEKGQTRLMYKNTDLTTFDACYVRLFPQDFVFGEIVLDILDNSGVYLPTSVEAFPIVNHKYYTVKVLSKIGLPVPATTLCVSFNPALNLTAKLGFPVVVKLLSGFGGRGVMKVETEEEFKPLLDTLEVFKEFITTQEYIKNRGEDIRCYVVGEEVFTVKRFAAAGDWRANVSRGGTARLVEVPDEYKGIALKAAKLMGLELCAVDLLETDYGPIIIELNYAPGIIWKMFGTKFAHIFMKFIYRKTKEHKMII